MWKNKNKTNPPKMINIRVAVNDRNKENNQGLSQRDLRAGYLIR